MDLTERLQKIDQELILLIHEPRSDKNQEDIRRKFEECYSLFNNVMTYKEYDLIEEELHTFNLVLKALYQDCYSYELPALPTVI